MPVKPALGSTGFSSPLPTGSQAPASNAPTMLLRTKLRNPVRTGSARSSGVKDLLSKADEYMAYNVKKQYLMKANPMGIYNVQCTEGSVKGLAEVSRVRSLGMKYRMKQASTSKKTYDMYENRKNAVVNSHECHHEEVQFSSYRQVAETYNVAKAEASGSCFRYASPETVEEAAMLRYMDIQMKAAVNPSGVYNIWCNEGTVKGQAEDIRVIALNTAYRQGQKSALKLMNEKYQQKKQGFIATHGCNYEEGLVSLYPALGACFRSKSYGY